ncbi:hypothetical protein ACFX13_022165 [Malus domestica]|uniref:Major allergen Mal d 1 n=1 Tax=Malus domestica TaxID=3750 RepID=A0A498HPU8_MALDO|nr:hypothetical protein DVH24_025443 [Malus domestica]
MIYTDSSQLHNTCGLKSQPQFIYKYHLYHSPLHLNISSVQTILLILFALHLIIFSSQKITMGVFTYETEFISVIHPPRLFKAFILDADNLIPKLAPQAVKGIEILEGNGGVGTIKKVTFGEGSQLGFVKHRIDGIDKDNFVYSYTLIEGDGLLSDKIEKVAYETKLVASPDGGSIVKSTSHYHAKGDVEIKEEQVKAGKEQASGLFKLVESYLLANPDAYN